MARNSPIPAVLPGKTMRRRHWPDRTRLAVVVASILLTAIVGGLLWMNYKSQHNVRNATGRQFVQDAERMADTLSYFFSERLGDMLDLAESHEMLVFFENKALGMSMEYGLKASLTAIEDRLYQTVDQNKMHDHPIYERILFVDRGGKVMASAPADGSHDGTETDLSPYLQAEYRTPHILPESGRHLLKPVFSLAYYYKGRYEGQLLAWLSRDLVANQLLKPETGLSRRTYGLEVPDGRLFLGGKAMDGSMPIRIDAQTREIDRLATVRLGLGSSGAMFVFTRLPVNKTPFMFLMAAPQNEVYGRTLPRHVTVALGILAMLAIGTTIILWRANTRNMVLFARLEETRKREGAIQLKNLELEAEIDRREQAEQALKQYQQNLEHLVQARTAALEQAQKELVTKAIEAGRAQLSAMVLHNIGNAVTPVIVLLETLKTSQINEISFYLEKCHLELQHNLSQLDGYFQRHPRSKDVLDYLGQLISGLKEDHQRRCGAEAEITEAVGYIAEILTMQQNYAASEQEIKSRVDLNRLLNDAIRMQTGSLERRGIVVVKRFDDQLPELLIDSNRLMQLVVNIIKNGYEAIGQHEQAPTEKKMTIETFIRDDQVGFAISDTGIGVAEDQIGHLFEFGRSGKGSSGFGLYYCKMFVAANQGRLTLESPGPGGGATVRVSFNPAPDPKIGAGSQGLHTE